MPLFGLSLHEQHDAKRHNVIFFHSIKYMLHMSMSPLNDFMKNSKQFDAVTDIHLHCIFRQKKRVNKQVSNLMM